MPKVKVLFPWLILVFPLISAIYLLLKGKLEGGEPPILLLKAAIGCGIGLLFGATVMLAGIAQLSVKHGIRLLVGSMVGSILGAISTLALGYFWRESNPRTGHGPMVGIVDVEHMFIILLLWLTGTVVGACLGMVIATRLDRLDRQPHRRL